VIERPPPTVAQISASWSGASPSRLAVGESGAGRPGEAARAPGTTRAMIEKIVICFVIVLSVGTLKVQDVTEVATMMPSQSVVVSIPAYPAAA
jgi:hypothetical protein